MNHSLFKAFLDNNLIFDNRIYLVEKISDECGFFAFDKKLCFAAKSKSSKKDSVSTNYVEYIPNNEIEAIENDSSFERGI